MERRTCYLTVLLFLALPSLATSADITQEFYRDNVIRVHYSAYTRGGEPLSATEFQEIVAEVPPAVDLLEQAEKQSAVGVGLTFLGLVGPMPLAMLVLSIFDRVPVQIYAGTVLSAAAVSAGITFVGALWTSRASSSVLDAVWECNKYILFSK